MNELLRELTPYLALLLCVPLAYFVGKQEKETKPERDNKDNNFNDIKLPNAYINKKVINAIQNAIINNPILTINNGETYIVGEFAITRNSIYFENVEIACNNKLECTAPEAWKIVQNATSGTLEQNFLKSLAPFKI